MDRGTGDRQSIVEEDANVLCLRMVRVQHRPDPVYMTWIQRVEIEIEGHN